MSQYLGRGSTSKGRMTITPGLSTFVAEHPYLRTPGDKEAVIKSLNNLRSALGNYPNLTWSVPTKNVTTEAYLDTLVVSASARRSNHWIGKPTVPSARGLNGIHIRSKGLTHYRL